MTVTNEIRRTKTKLQLLEQDNINWVLEDFIQEFKTAIDNPINFPDQVLQNNLIIEEVRQILYNKYKSALGYPKEENQLEFKFYGEG